MEWNELFMRRCFDLARLGNGYVAPNPMVGSVLVHHNQVIGEGYHAHFGQAHAEVNACLDVDKQQLDKLKEAMLYVSLEPCCTTGHTPPCTDLILEKGIPRVVISTQDQSPGIAGKSIKILQSAGLEVLDGLLNKEGKALYEERNTLVMLGRPKVILKYAQSKDGFIGIPNKQIWLTNALSKRLVHKWRSEVGAIIVGTNTALIDNPQLTNRLYFGPSPLRIVLDRQLRLPPHLALFDDQQATWIITEQNPPQHSFKQTHYQQLSFDQQLLPELLRLLAAEGISSLIVEGGAQLLNAFIQEQLWDEIRVFTASTELKQGIPAPKLTIKPQTKHQIGSDQLQIFKNSSGSG